MPGALNTGGDIDQQLLGARSAAQFASISPWVHQDAEPEPETPPPSSTKHKLNPLRLLGTGKNLRRTSTMDKKWPRFRKDKDVSPLTPMSTRASQDSQTSGAEAERTARGAPLSHMASHDAAISTSDASPRPAQSIVLDTNMNNIHEIVDMTRFRSLGSESTQTISPTAPEPAPALPDAATSIPPPSFSPPPSPKLAASPPALVSPTDVSERPEPALLRPRAMSAYAAPRKTTPGTPNESADAAESMPRISVDNVGGLPARSDSKKCAACQGLRLMTMPMNKDTLSSISLCADHMGQALMSGPSHALFGLPWRRTSGTSSPTYFQPTQRGLRRSSSPRSHLLQPLPMAGPSVAGSATSWTPPASWAVMQHEGDAVARNLAAEYPEDDESGRAGPAWHRVRSYSPASGESDSIETAGITIYEPLDTGESISRSSTPHVDHAEQRRSRFFWRPGRADSHHDATPPAVSEGDTSQDGFAPITTTKHALMTVGNAAFGRRHRSSHLPFMRKRPGSRDFVDAPEPILPEAATPPRGVATERTEVGAAEVPMDGKTFMRIYLQDDTYVMISCALETTAAEVAYALGRYSPLDTQGFRLFLYERGMDRPLVPTERPARLFRRRLLQAGYTDEDGLDGMGRLDLSYLLRFVYRADRISSVNVATLQAQDHTYKHLNLQAMHLTLIPVPVYRFAQWIVSLDLSMNPLMDLPQDFVEMCTSLRMLRLSSLALKRVPDGVVSIPSLTQLDVSSNRLADLEPTPLHELALLRVIRAGNNRLSSLPAYVAQMSSLMYLNLSNNLFESFPLHVCSVPNLCDLDLSFNRIKHVPPEIAQLTRLERLVLVGNQLQRLPSEMKELQALRVLDVRHTRLHSLEVLTLLPHLERVHADHNYVTSIEVPLNTALSALHLSHNPLSRATVSAAATSQLTHVDLSHANLVTLPDRLLSSVPQLRHLVLDQNQIVSLPSLQDVPLLEHLSCAGNALSQLPESVGRLSKLVTLVLPNNNLRTVPATLWQCASLHSLNLSSNLLQSWPAPMESATSPLRTSLKRLRLADNRLGDDVFSTVALLSGLEELNLAMNEIYDVPSGALASLPSLHTLYLSSNNLSALPADDLEHLPKLSVLFLNNNKLHTLPAELGRLKQLRAIDVGTNLLKYNIANWHYDWNWNANPELRYLNLSGNQRFEIKPKRTDVDGREKNVADFNRLRHLRILGLMEVTVTHQPLPDESDHRRVRTTLGHVGAMPYGIADSIAWHDAVHVFDLVVPSFRGRTNEALLGLVQGHSSSLRAGTRIARYITDHAPRFLEQELDRAEHASAKDPVALALRRTFLRLNQQYAEHVLHHHAEHAPRGSTSDNAHGQEVFWGWGAPSTPDTLLWQASATAIYVYMRDHTLYIANVGRCIGVLSRIGGLVKPLGHKHDAMDNDETQRIRAAEGWVSLRYHVNDKLDVTRAFGHFHLTPVVSACPSVMQLELTDADEFLILANGELWKYLSYQMAVDIARMDREDPRLAAQRLRDTAIAYGASDYVSVMVLTVGGLFHERLNAHAQALHAQPRGSDASKKVARRARTDHDSTLARLEREVMPPTGHVALVFTDIKSSTQLWETTLSMQSAIRLHNLLLRRHLRGIGGYEVKTEGDAFMVSFQTVSAALLWCFSVQIRLLTADWPQEILDTEQGRPVYADDGTLLYRGLRVRMGIHYGWPVCEVDPVNNRMDYFGPMVNRSARISGAADGGQIMVSQDVVEELQTLFQKYSDDDLLQDVGGEALPEWTTPRDIVLLRRLGLGIISMGVRRLKGIETPEALSLVYPKLLAKRYQHLAGARRSSDSLQMYEPTQEVLSLGQIKQLGFLCLRLEALSNQRCFPGISPHDPWYEIESASKNQPTAPVPGAKRCEIVERLVERAPELLIIASREDATDTELIPVLMQLITRIRNAVNSIALRLVQQSRGTPAEARALQLLLADLDGVQLS